MSSGRHRLKMGASPRRQVAPLDQNRRRVRLSGRDQETGQNFGAEVWLPQGYGGDRRTGDAALRTLVDRDPYTECSGLAELQRRLNQHYRS